MDDILLEGSGTDRRCAGILTADGEKLRARSVVVTTGVYNYICVYLYIDDVGRTGTGRKSRVKHVYERMRNSIMRVRGQELSCVA